MTELIRSPINYTGNKFRLLPQLLPLFPDHITTFVDVFSGGGTVGLNVSAQKVICVDKNKRVVDLLRYLATNSVAEISRQVEEQISYYGLTYSLRDGLQHYKDQIKDENGLKYLNEKGYLQLRNDYNALPDKTTPEASLKLYLLTLYCFSSAIRFNRQGDFNMPCGKRDCNKKSRDKLLTFEKRAKDHIDFLCQDFRELELTDKNTFVYLDPPYLLTDAVYNENGGWGEQDEKDLLAFLTDLNIKGIRFALSNVLCRQGKTNTLLENFIKGHNFRVVDIKINYSNASYHKKDRQGTDRKIVVLNY